MGFPGGSADKESACNVGDLGLIPGMRRFPGKGNGHPLQYSGLENSTDYTVTKSWTRQNDFHFHLGLTSMHCYYLKQNAFPWKKINKYEERERNALQRLS